MNNLDAPRLKTPHGCAKCFSSTLAIEVIVRHSLHSVMKQKKGARFSELTVICEHCRKKTFRLSPAAAKRVLKYLHQVKASPPKAKKEKPS